MSTTVPGQKATSAHRCGISVLPHFWTHSPQHTASPPAWCHSQEPALSHAPHWSRESRLSRRHLVRPNDHLFAVLPLDRHCFMSSLIPALIDCEVAKDRPCLKRKQCFPQLFGVETAGLPYRVYQKLASGISSRRLDRRRMVELFLIGHNELLVSRIRKRGVPE